MSSPAKEILFAIEKLRSDAERPIIVALDGGSGAGKSTIAQELQKLVDASLVPLDDFYQTSIPEADLPNLSVEERLDAAFEWARVRSDALQVAGGVHGSCAFARHSDRREFFCFSSSKGSRRSRGSRRGAD